MTPWLRLWFPHADDPEDTAPPRDAALWSPQALMQNQQDMWAHGAHEMRQWWSLCFTAWPSLPVLPLAGLLPPAPLDPSPPQPASSTPSATGLADIGSAPLRARRPRPAPAAKKAAPARPRRAARGK